MLDPSVVQEIVSRATAELATAQADTRRESLEHECAALDRELGRLTEALATGGELAPLLAAVRARQQRRDELTAAINQCGRPPRVLDPKTLRAALEERVRDWRGLLRKHVEQGQQLLQRVIVGRLTLTPTEAHGQRYYRFAGQGTWARMLAGVVQNVASPRGNPISPIPLLTRVRRPARWSRR